MSIKEKMEGAIVKKDTIGPHVVYKNGSYVHLKSHGTDYGRVKQWKCKYCGYEDSDRASFTWRSRSCNGEEWLESEEIAHREREPDYGER